MLDNPQNKNQLYWLWLSMLVIVLDQLTKWLALKHLIAHVPVVINRFFNITLDFNQGAAFSFLNRGNGWQIWFFSAIAAIVSIAIVIHLKKMREKNNLNAAALALILGGAVGNLIDRLMHRYVIDFISWHINDYYWPTFNIADSAVCLGAFLLILGISRDKK